MPDELNEARELIEADSDLIVVLRAEIRTQSAVSIAVMHFVDKWFEEGDPRLSLPPADRANQAREIALQWGDNLQRQRDALLQAAAEVREMLRIVADGRATLPPGKAAAMRARLALAIRATRPLHPSELP